MKVALFILSALFVVFLSCITFADNEHITLGNNTFCIPKRYSILDQVSGSFFNIKRADINNYVGSFQVAIDPPEVKKSIPEYLINHGDLPAVFFINVRQAPTEEIERSLNRKSYADALQLTNSYENAYIEYDKHNNSYRVSDFGFPPPFIFWEVLNIKPDKNIVVPVNTNDYHVASCSRAGGHNGNSSSCEYSLAFDGYLVDIKTTENNLHLKNKITKYSKYLLVSWRQNCE